MSIYSHLCLLIFIYSRDDHEKKYDNTIYQPEITHAGGLLTTAICCTLLVQPASGKSVSMS